MSKKFAVTIVQTKVISIVTSGKDADDAVLEAKKTLSDDKFDSRIGTKSVAGVRELKDDSVQ